VERRGDVDPLPGGEPRLTENGEALLSGKRPVEGEGGPRAACFRLRTDQEVREVRIALLIGVQGFPDRRRVFKREQILV
jgi:hypothetical protein